jgi:hypothetical protein
MATDSSYRASDTGPTEGRMPSTTKTSRHTTSRVLPNQLPLFEEGESTPLCGACGQCAFTRRNQS